MSREWFEDPVVLKVKRTLLKSGNNGIREIITAFRNFNKDNDATLSPQEFSNGLKSRGITLTNIELNHLVNAFDKDGDGMVSMTEFVSGMSSGLPHRRRAVLEKVFNTFDTDGDGNIPLPELQNRYDANAHPGVVRGEISVQDAFETFFTFFSEDTNPEGLISKEEFMTYYAGVSNNITDDDYFEDVVLCVYGLDTAEDPPDTSYGTVLNAKARGAVQQLGKTLDSTMSTQHRAAAASAKLQSCYAGVTQSSHRTYDTTKYRSQREEDIGVPPPQMTNYETSYAASYKGHDGKQWEMSRAPRAFETNAVKAAPLQSVNTLNPTGIPIVDTVRKKIFERGGKSGFRGLTRVLRIMDDNGNKSLDRFELQNGLQMYGIHVNKAEMDLIMNYFDRDGSGSITVTEFVRGIRGKMSRERQQLVMMAYQILDINGDETVTMSEMQQLYDTEKHPDVINKSKTREQVMQEFIKGWDKNADGKIIFEEFMDYYNDISAGIDSDQYFELMIRNAWHISGGKGEAANTSCRRVLVVFNDGTQRVEEIKNDLGIGPKDKDLMIQNLNAQGITNIKRIELAF